MRPSTAGQQYIYKSGFSSFSKGKTRVIATNTKTRVRRDFLYFLLVRALGLGESSLDSPFSPRILNHKVSLSWKEIRENARIRLED